MFPSLMGKGSAKPALICTSVWLVGKWMGKKEGKAAFYQGSENRHAQM